MQYLLDPRIPAGFLSYISQFDFVFYPIQSGYRGRYLRGNLLISFFGVDVDITHFAEPVSAKDARLKARHVETWPAHSRTHLFTGIDKLDFIAWAQLLDLTGAIPFKEVLSSISRKEISSLFSTIASRIGWPGISPELLNPVTERNQLEGVPA